MPNLNEFLNVKKEIPQDSNTTFEILPGPRPCSKCDIDADGGLWDPENLVMSWTCSNGHETIYRVG
jgi:hypothetical protein